MINVEQFQAMGKEQLEAFQAAATEVTKGLQSIATEATEFSKKSFEGAQAHVQTLSGIKNIEEAVKLNTEFAKASFEGLVAQATKVGELYQAVAKEAVKPVEAAIAKAQAAAK